MEKLAPELQSQQNGALPACIADFLAATRVGSPLQAAMMGDLAGQVSPEQFAAMCEYTARGVAYVYQRFGTVPAAIVLSDEDRTNAHYNTGTQAIYIPRKRIATLLRYGLCRESKTEPFVLSSYEMAAISGVEEAFHHYQYTSNPQRTARLAAMEPAEIPHNGFTPGYSDNPLELEATEIMQQAMRDFGFDHTVYEQIPGARPLDYWQNHAAVSTQQIFAQR